jgi:hypothetical protein
MNNKCSGFRSNSGHFSEFRFIFCLLRSRIRFLFKKKLPEEGNIMFCKLKIFVSKKSWIPVLPRRLSGCRLYGTSSLSTHYFFFEFVLTHQASLLTFSMYQLVSCKSDMVKNTAEPVPVLYMKTWVARLVSRLVPTGTLLRLRRFLFLLSRQSHVYSTWLYSRT